MSDENYIFSLKDDIIYPIQIEDLMLVKDDNCSEKIFQNLYLITRNGGAKSR